MKFTLKLNPQGQIYLPKELREDLLEEEIEVEIHPNLRTAILIPKGSDPKQVLRSLETLQKHFEQMVEEEEAN